MEGILVRRLEYLATLSSSTSNVAASRNFGLRVSVNNGSLSCLQDEII